MNKSNLSDHLWLPNVYEFKGGIQVYLGFFLKALHSLYPSNSYEIFVKHDTHYPKENELWPNARFHFLGKWPLAFRTLTFATEILIFGLIKKPRLTVAAHLNFAVIAHWLNRLVKTRYWIVVYGIETWDVQRPALRAALRSADRILAISSYTKRRLIDEQNIDPDKISLLPCAFDASRFSIKPKPDYLLQKYSLSSNQPVILTVSRLADVERYKGYDQILSALPNIRKAIPNVHYVIVGKGSDRPRIEQIIAKKGLQDCVTLAGFVPDDQLCDHYNLSDVFAMPSKLEGFGIVYLEAMACGKPALGGNQDGAVDALCNGRLGALIDPDNVQEIANTLIQILNKSYPNPLIYQPEALRQTVIETYGFKAFETKLSALLTEFA